MAQANDLDVCRNMNHLLLCVHYNNGCVDRVEGSRNGEGSQADPGVSQDSLLNLHYTKVERSNEDDTMDVVLESQALHVQVLPGFVQAAAALAAHCLHALKVNKASGMQSHHLIPFTTKASLQLSCTMYALNELQWTVHIMWPCSHLPSRCP